jgi:hypothetical protein
MIRGLNSRLNVIRESLGSIDRVGGAVTTESYVYFNVPCRIANPRVSREELEQGVVSSSQIRVVAPSRYRFTITDLLEVLDGAFAETRWRVVDISEDSLPITSPRAHVTVTAERFVPGST